MAKYRMISTSMWEDEWYVTLNVESRYLWGYFLTNSHTNLCGIYKLPLRIISFETLLKESKISQIISTFSPKMFYIDGWVFLPNFQKHQKLTNPKVKRGIEIEMSKIPDQIHKKIYTMDSLSIGYVQPTSHLNLNLNLNSLIKDIKEEPAAQIETINKEQQVIDAFNAWSGRKILKTPARLNVVSKAFADGYSADDIANAFKNRAKDKWWVEHQMDKDFESMFRKKNSNKDSVDHIEKYRDNPDMAAFRSELQKKADQYKVPIEKFWESVIRREISPEVFTNISGIEKVEADLLPLWDWAARLFPDKK